MFKVCKSWRKEILLILLIFALISRHFIGYSSYFTGLREMHQMEIFKKIELND